MSTTEETRKVTIPTLRAMTERAESITMVVAYDYPSGRIADEAGIEVVLVGDSLAMTMLGQPDTLSATRPCTCPGHFTHPLHAWSTRGRSCSPSIGVMQATQDSGRRHVAGAVGRLLTLRDSPRDRLPDPLVRPIRIKVGDIRAEDLPQVPLV